MEIFPIVTLLRLIVPLLTLRFPLPGILLSMLVDLYDWQFLQLTTSRDYENYQVWDKVFDLYYQLIILAVVISFKDRLIRNIAIFFFLYRLTGIALAFLFSNRQFLFYFPNFFENFVLLYLIFLLISKQEKMFYSVRNIGIVILAIVIPKLIHEYFQHFLEKHPWEIYDIGQHFGTTGTVQEYINYLSWGGVFYLLPLGVALFLIRKNSLNS